MGCQNVGLEAAQHRHDLDKTCHVTQGMQRLSERWKNNHRYAQCSQSFGEQPFRRAHQHGAAMAAIADAKSEIAHMSLGAAE